MTRAEFKNLPIAEQVDRLLETFRNERDRNQDGEKACAAMRRVLLIITAAGMTPGDLFLWEASLRRDCQSVDLDYDATVKRAQRFFEGWVAAA